MTDPQREDWSDDDPRSVIAAIKARDRSVYFVAKLMGLHVTQVLRMEQNGRCQPHHLTRLREILALVIDEERKVNEAHESQH